MPFLPVTKITWIKSNKPCVALQKQPFQSEHSKFCTRQVQLLYSTMEKTSFEQNSPSILRLFLTPNIEAKKSKREIMLFYHSSQKQGSIRSLLVYFVPSPKSRTSLPRLFYNLITIGLCIWTLSISLYVAWHCLHPAYDTTSFNPNCSRRSSKVFFSNIWCQSATRLILYPMVIRARWI